MAHGSNDANGIWQYGEDDNPNNTWSGTLNLLAASVSAALSALLAKRNRYTYRWANAAARGAQAGMRVDDTGYQIDTDLIYRYDGAAWRVWEKASTAFVPTWTNLTVGAGGTQGARYSISQGRVTVEGFFTLGTGSAIGTNPYQALPVAGDNYITSAPNSGNDRPLGQVLFEDAGVNLYDGKVATKNVTVGGTPHIFAALFAINASTTYGTVTAATAAIPFAFGTADFFTYSYSYLAD